ncbi:MAG: hypothetical protein ACQEQE_07995 [Bacillota bacterium]
MGQNIKEEFNEMISVISLEIMKKKPMKDFYSTIDDLKSIEKDSAKKINNIKKDINMVKKSTDKNKENIVESLKSSNKYLNEKIDGSNKLINDLKDKINIINKRSNLLLIFSLIQFLIVIFLAYKVSVL